MTTRHPSALTLAVMTVVATLVFGACGSSAPALTDPKEIVTAALTSTEAAKSVHLDVTVDGTATIALPGAGTAGAPIKLDGTTGAVDLDLAGGGAKATFTAPALFNVTGDVIVVGGKAYLKTTLQGQQYQVVDLGQALAVDPTDTGSMVDALGDFLLKPGVDPVKGDDVACGSAQCYTVKVDLTADELAALGGGAAATAGLPVDLSGASLAVTVRVEKDLPHHLAGLTAAVTSGDGSVLTLDAILSRWDAAVTIAAPPADQIQAGG
jgi:LppX_LprAFG lipoprotein